MRVSRYGAIFFCGLIIGVATTPLSNFAKTSEEPATTQATTLATISAPENKIGAEIAVLSQRISRLSAQLNQVSANYDQLRIQIAPLLAPSMSAERHRPPLSEAEIKTAIDEAQANAAIAAQKRRDFLFQFYSNEQRDHIWSDEAEENINTFVAKFGKTATENANIECRTTLCRITLKISDSAILEAMLSEFPFQVTWQGGTEITTTSDVLGNPITELIVARHDFSIPDMPTDQ